MSSSAVAPELGPFAGHALVVSNDLAMIRQLSDAMHQFAFTVDICSDVTAAAILIYSRKFQAILLDMASEQELSKVLDVIACSPSNQTSVTVAISELRARLDSRFRPNFMMQRPLTNLLIENTLKAAMGLVIRDLRRYFRCPINGQATIQTAGEPQINCEMINISEGGMAINTSIPPHSGAAVEARFVLPDTAGEFHVEAEVCWSDNRGRAGLRFRSLSSEQRAKLQGWLSNKIAQGLPEPVLRFFNKKQ
jgi:PilZ domain-containing protein